MVKVKLEIFGTGVLIQKLDLANYAFMIAGFAGDSFDQKRAWAHDIFAKVGESLECVLNQGENFLDLVRVFSHIVNIDLME